MLTKISNNEVAAPQATDLPESRAPEVCDFVDSARPVVPVRMEFVFACSVGNDDDVRANERFTQLT